jgi:hypothetical protein
LVKRQPSLAAPRVQRLLLPPLEPDFEPVDLLPLPDLAPEDEELPLFPEALLSSLPRLFWLSADLLFGIVLTPVLPLGAGRIRGAHPVLPSRPRRTGRRGFNRS